MEMANAWKIAQEKVQAPEVLWGLMGRRGETGLGNKAFSLSRFWLIMVGR